MSTRFPTARLTLGQMRRSTGRLVSAGIAITIGTAFVAATLLAGNIISGATYDQVSAQYADSDLVVSDKAMSLTQADVEAVRATDGVAAANGSQSSYVELNYGGKTVYQSVVSQASDPRLTPLVLADGAWPEGTDSIALPTGAAERLGLGVGDTISSSRWVLDDERTEAPDGTSYYDGQEVTEKLTVSGLVDDPNQAFALAGGMGVISPEAMAQWRADEREPGETDALPEILVALDQPGDQVALEEIRDALAAAVPTATEVVTTQEYAEEVVASLTGGQNVIFLVFVLGFAAVALVVAGLVIANTFQVLVAQRSRTLALLRAIGADTGQIYRSVLLEAALLGFLASVAGVLLGALLVQGGLLVVPAFDLAVPLPETITVSAPVVLLPLAVGVLVTLAAALAPARSASRVAPLAALRPTDAPTLRGAGRVRAVLAGLATFGGLAVLAGGVYLGMSGSVDVGVLAAVLGGCVSLVGVVIGAVFWLPKVAAAIGRLLGTAGPAARLAAANTQRNPRRTAATATALLIGVTLVSMMTTGAASARLAMDEELDAQYPVDLQVSSASYGAQGNLVALPGSVTDAVRDVDALRAVAEVTAVTATVGGDAESVLPVTAAAPDELGAVLSTPGDVESLERGTLLLPDGLAEDYGVEGHDTLTLTGPAGEVTLDVVSTDLRTASAYLTPLDLAAFTEDVSANTLWGSVAEGQDPLDAVTAVQDAVSVTGEAVDVTGAVVERQSYQEVIDVALGIVVGLLAVAVIIALIGVANTLSLSVVERTRENAMLRAIGLSTGQLRATLAIEGMLIAGVGAVLGILLGLAYGWAGAASALSTLGTVPLAVPWAEIAIVLGVALVAGLVASVVPAQAAVRTRPVAALATE